MLVSLPVPGGVIVSTNDPFENHPLTFTSFAGAHGPQAQVTIRGDQYWSGPAVELDRVCVWWLTLRGWLPAQSFPIGPAACRNCKQHHAPGVESCWEIDPHPCAGACSDSAAHAEGGHDI